jgi:hypothetical protein
MLGSNPSKIFHSFLDNKEIEPKKILFYNKGGIFHFKKIFKTNLKLSGIYKNFK